MNQPASNPVKHFFHKENLFTSLFVNTFLFLSVLFFAPMEIYLGNIAQFSFPFPSTWVILLGASLICIFIFTVLLCLLPKKAATILNLFLFGLGLCCYVQSMFLNGNMGTLTGDEIVYGRNVILINLLVWVFILAVVFAVYFLLKRRAQEHMILVAVKFISLALTAMQLVAFVSVAATTPASGYEKGDYLTTDGLYALSSNKNAVVFVLDTFDANYLDEALTDNADLLQNLKGFTYYPNAVSTHSRTYPSVPYMLTGNISHFDKPYNEYVDEAYTNSSFLPDLKSAGCDIRLFTDSQYIGASAKPIISNHGEYEHGLFSNVSIQALVRQMLKVSLYRNAPYLLKDYFEYDISSLNSQVMRTSNRYTIGGEAVFYQDLSAKKIVIGEAASAFRYYHFNGLHPGFTLNENAETADAPVSMNQTIRGNFRIIEEYIRQMQDLGIYEDATIIITADHGNSGGNISSLDLPAAARPIIIAKPAGKGQKDAFSISQAPVGHADLFATIIEGIGGNKEPYGQTLFEINETDSRDRYYYYSSLYSDGDGEVALREYKVNGDAKDLSNYKLTGKYWDINYSENTVSKKRLSDTE